MGIASPSRQFPFQMMLCLQLIPPLPGSQLPAGAWGHSWEGNVFARGNARQCTPFGRGMP